MIETFERWAVLRVRKNGGVVVFVSLHDTEDDARGEAEYLGRGQNNPHRYSVTPVVITPKEPEK